MFALIVGAWLALSTIVGVCAIKRDLNGTDYFFLSLFLSPIIGFAIFILRSPAEGFLSDLLPRHRHRS